MDINVIAASLIEKYANKIMTKSFSKVRDISEKLKIDFNIAFKEYLINSYDKYSKIRTIIYKPEPKYLYDFFECNVLKYKNSKIESCNIDNLLDISNFLIVEGTGGIGKSTMMKHLFLNELSKSELIPIFLELKDINSFNDSFFDFIYTRINILGINFEREYLEYALENGCFLILLDGYDEVTSDRASILINEIRDFCDRYSQNYYIISSRPNDLASSLDRFSLFKMIPFTKEQAISLINKIDYDPDCKKNFTEQLESRLYNEHKSFASNPLLLNIMLLTFDNYAQIPDKLHIFYSNAFETMFFKHDATKSGFSRQVKSGLSFDDFKNVFSAFCFRTYMKEQYQFSYSELSYLLNEISKQKISFMPCDFISDLINVVCVMFNDGLNYYFSHRSFQEYFTALYIQNMTDEQQYKVYEFLLNKTSSLNDKLTVLGMLIEMSQERFEKNALIRILTEIENRVDEKSNAYDVYFDYLISNVSFIPEGKDKISIGRGVRIKDNNRTKIECVFKISRKYKLKDNNGNERNDSCFTIDELGSLWGITDFDIEYFPEDFKKPEYQKFYQFIKEKTWIGSDVMRATILLELIKNKQNEEIKQLDELLTF